MAVEPITGLTYQEAGMLQTDVLQNELLNYFAVWSNCSVISLALNDPPVSPSNGDRYIVGGTPTGDWAGFANWLAVYRDAWEFYEPKEGDSVILITDLSRYSFDGSGWVAAGAETTAAGVSYDNATSGLAATDVQDAIDELAAEKLNDAPSDDKQYARKNAAWEEVTAPAPTINIVTTITSGTITPAGDTDLVRPAALSANLTIANPSSTPLDGAGFVVDVIDDGTSRTLTWGTKYATRMATLPTATTAGKRHRIGLEYNAADDKLYCMYAQVQA